MKRYIPGLHSRQPDGNSPLEGATFRRDEEEPQTSQRLHRNALPLFS